MTRYVQRRNRWCHLLTQVNKSLSMSEVMLGELLLEHAGLTSTERLMVMTSANNYLAFDKVAEVLVKEDALSRGSSRDYRTGKGKGGRTKDHWRSNASRGYLAFEKDEEYDHQEPEDYGPAWSLPWLRYISYDGGAGIHEAWLWYGTWDDWSQAFADEECRFPCLWREIDSCIPDELANPAADGIHGWRLLRDMEYEDPFAAELQKLAETKGVQRQGK